MPATDKIKTFFFKHTEKLILGLAAAGFIYVVVTGVSGRGISAVILEINDKAGRLKGMMENPPAPDPPPIPIPQSIDKVLKSQDSPSAAFNPFDYRDKRAPGARPAEGKPIPQPVAAGPAPPAKVAINATAGINAVQWWRATGQGAKFRVDVFRIEKDKLPWPVPEVVTKQTLNQLGFQPVGREVAAGPDGIGVYNDSNILGETAYVYALRSIRVEEVVTKEKVSSGDIANIVAELVAAGVDPQDAIGIAQAEVKSVVKTKVEVKVTATGDQFRTAEVVSAIPVRFRLASVRVDDAGEPIGRVLVERLIGGRWAGYTFNNIRKGELIGDYKDILIRPQGGRPYKDRVDLRTRATCIRFEEFDASYIKVIKGREITISRKSWKMIYRDKDGNVGETKKQLLKR